MSFQILLHGNVVAPELPTLKRAKRKAVALYCELHDPYRRRSYTWSRSNDLLVADEEGSWATGFSITAQS